MASLIPEAAKTAFTTALSDHFDTFKATITVNKEPQRTVSLTADQIYMQVMERQKLR